jgi:3',5'-cyclic AMP phosphodiesterase CpdA
LTRFLQSPVALLSLLAILGIVGCLGDSDTLTIGAPPVGSRYQFNVFGDTQDGYPIYAALIDLALSTGIPAFNVRTGDMIADPDRGGIWSVFMAYSEPLIENGGLLPVIGNHDVTDQASMDRFLAVFPDVPVEGYYCRTINTCFCVILNSEELGNPGRLGAVQMAWLDAQLGSPDALASEITIVFVHRPPFPLHHHADSPLMDNAALHQLLLAHGVQVVMSGHEHDYTHEVRDGIHYIIAGSSGAPMQLPSSSPASFYHFVQGYMLSDRLVLRVFDVFGRKRDEIEILF